MEIKSIKNKFFRRIFKDQTPALEKLELNWPFVLKLAVIGLIAIVLAILAIPTKKEDNRPFHEKADPESISIHPHETSSPEDYLNPNSFKGNQKTTSAVFDYLSQSPGGRTASQPLPNRNSPMILARSGFDAKNQLPPGTRIPLKLTQKATVSSQAMPIMATVTTDVYQEGSLAIPEGSTFLGEVSFDDSLGRGQVSFRHVHFPDGRERQLSSLATSIDGQMGIEGNVHSDSFKNTAGQLASRFISAFAEGSMSRGSLGASPGGSDNGLKNAVAETARDRGEAWADDLKRQKKWIEIETEEPFLAVLTQAFTFRDPGTLYGQ